MNKVKYQIFVSSTYEDLKEERDQVIKACLEMGHIPVGMEMFSAADEKQWQIITRRIDESDYYVVIVADRYGSMVDGMSYTEKEYDYAVSKGIPTLGFVLDSKASWPVERQEKDKKARSKLEAFKRKVKSKPVGFWSSKEDLHGKCAIALMMAFDAQLRPGWVRSSEVAGPETTAELTRLSSENNRLRQELAEVRKAADTSGFAQGEDVVEMDFTIVFSDTHKTIVYKTTWHELFLIIAKTIIRKPIENVVKGKVMDHYRNAIMLLAYQIDQFGVKDYETFSKVVSFGLPDDEFEIVKTQFLALGFIQIAHVNQENIWSLTSEGQRQYAARVAKRRTDGSVE